MSWTMFGAAMTVIVVCIVVLVVVIKDLSKKKRIEPIKIQQAETTSPKYMPEENAKFAKNIKIFAIILALVVLFFIIRAISEKVIENRIVEYFTEDSETYVVLVQKATDYKVSGKPFAKFYFVCVRYDYGTCNTYLVIYNGGEISVRG